MDDRCHTPSSLSVSGCYLPVAPALLLWAGISGSDPGSFDVFVEEEFFPGDVFSLDLSLCSSFLLIWM